MGNLPETTAAWRLPVHTRTNVCREVALSKDVVGDVRQTVVADRVVQRVELDALGRIMGTSAVSVDVADPESGWHISYENLLVN